MFEFYFLIIRY